VAVAERFGMIFAQPEGQAPLDVGEQLGALGPELAEYRFEDLRFFDQRGGVFEANWKLIHDTFTETYHVFSLHRDTLAPDLLSTPFVGDFYGANSRGVVMRKEVTGLLERDESEWRLRPYASIVYLLFPSVILNLPMSGHVELWEIYPEPGDPHRTRVTVRFYVPRQRHTEQEREFWNANVNFTQRVVFKEDFDQQQHIHRSLRTGLLPEVIYGRNEPALIHHHQQVELALTARAKGVAPDA
jgi:hypothetical protein